MVIELTVVTSDTQRFTFVGDPPRELSLADARRLWEAEQAINELTGLRVHVDVRDGASLDSRPCQRKEGR
jgi:hypothetical protein